MKSRTSLLVVAFLVAGFASFGGMQAVPDGNGNVLGLGATLAQVAPSITDARLKGKKLIITGANFADGARIFVDGVKQKTMNDPDNPTSILIGKKAGKKLGLDQIVKLQVLNPDGVLSDELAFYTGCGEE
jgi:hypothetical protein